MTFTLKRVSQCQQTGSVLANGSHQTCSLWIFGLEITVTPEAREGATHTGPRGDIFECWTDGVKELRYRISHIVVTSFGVVRTGALGAGPNVGAHCCSP